MVALMLPPTRAPFCPLCCTGPGGADVRVGAVLLARFQRDVRMIHHTSQRRGAWWWSVGGAACSSNSDGAGRKALPASCSSILRTARNNQKFYLSFRVTDPTLCVVYYPLLLICCRTRRQLKFSCISYYYISWNQTSSKLSLGACSCWCWLAYLSTPITPNRAGWMRAHKGVCRMPQRCAAVSGRWRNRRRPAAGAPCGAAAAALELLSVVLHVCCGRRPRRSPGEGRRGRSSSCGCRPRPLSPSAEPVGQEAGERPPGAAAVRWSVPPPITTWCGASWPPPPAPPAPRRPRAWPPPSPPSAPPPAASSGPGQTLRSSCCGTTAHRRRRRRRLGRPRRPRPR